MHVILPGAPTRNQLGGGGGSEAGMAEHRKKLMELGEIDQVMHLSRVGFRPARGERET